MSHKCLPVPVAPWNVGNGARELLNYGKGNVERETPWGRRVFVAVMGGGFTPGWAGLGQMDLKWCHQNQTWEREYGTRRTSGKRRFGRGVGIKWEQPTGNASCRVSYIDFVCRGVVPVTVHPHLLLLQSSGCIASIYNSCQALGISSTWAQEFDLFYTEMWSINVLF